MGNARLESCSSCLPTNKIEINFSRYQSMKYAYFLYYGVIPRATIRSDNTVNAEKVADQYLCIRYNV